jgi:hypothetical protein
MKRRVLLLMLSCIVLPLPLVGLVFMTMPQPHPQVMLRTDLLPVLGLDARRTLPTYERSCTRDEDCDPPLGCLRIESELRSECTDSRCMEDKDCPEGFSCLAFKTRSGKAMVRRCSLIGERKEGELCEPLARSLRLGCERGLLCQEGWCGRPCRPDDSSSCPSGSFCSDGRDGSPACIPTCEGHSCPEGQKCTPDQGGASFCMQVYGPDCRETPCGKDQVCRLMSPPQRPWEMRTECRRRCDSKKPCPEGTVCLRYECRQACDPEASAPCGPGLICGQYKPSDPWYCMAG